MNAATCIFSGRPTVVIANLSPSTDNDKATDKAFNVNSVLLSITPQNMTFEYNTSFQN